MEHSTEHTVNQCLIPQRFKFAPFLENATRLWKKKRTSNVNPSSNFPVNHVFCSITNSAPDKILGDKDRLGGGGDRRPGKGSFRTALSWKCSTSSLKVNGALMISFIHLLSSGLMVQCSHVDVFQIGWMFESLDKALLAASGTTQFSAAECKKFFRDRIYNQRQRYSHLTRHVSKSSWIERINLRLYDMFIAPCLSIALGTNAGCHIM